MTLDKAREFLDVIMALTPEQRKQLLAEAKERFGKGVRS